MSLLNSDPFADNGLSLVQTTDRAGEEIVLETLLLHETGEWIKGKLSINPDRLVSLIYIIPASPAF
jgi:hypothetical protein